MEFQCWDIICCYPPKPSAPAMFIYHTQGHGFSGASPCAKRMEDVELGCSVCQEAYDDSRARSPRNLGCGHSVCTACVEEIISRNRKCPECRRPFYAATASSLPVNYPLLRLSRSLAAMRLQQPQATAVATPAATSAPADGQQDAGECAAHVSRMIYRCMTCKVWACQDCLVMDHVLPPQGHCEILPVDQALEEMKKGHLEIISTTYQTLQGLKNYMASQISILDSNKRLHDETINSLRNITQGELNIVQDIDTKKKQITDKLSEVDCWVESLRETEACIVQAQSVRELANAKLAAKDCVSNVESCITKEQERHCQLQLILPQIGKHDLTGVLQMAKSMYVMHEDGGRQRWARVSVHDCLLHLHALTENPPPSNSLTFSYSSVRSLVPTEATTAFLDLGWQGQTQGRVYVRMFGDTRRGQQFLLLCSGEKGPCYRLTRFFDADRIGERGEIIRGGDYEHNDGTGGAAIMDGLLSGGVYHREAVAGLVVGAHASQAERLGVFGIILTEWPGNKTDTGFGLVTSGLGTLKSAARHKPVTDVTIENCGLVIPI
ncbi:uncharacterized protein [Penaeus vannamei]|uniref:RING-type domain-containing protein n=1 Tax=Penaeus vannamei TaxID=6689 RepID=A0A423T846_PENVA|nr:uncharacterized protein LOC113810645 isoform X2 [Penaeus vannamei]ROT72612.1 hypothetical protein C7M84_008973 [Penaeus vannamei]